MGEVNKFAAAGLECKKCGTPFQQARGRPVSCEPCAIADDRKAIADENRTVQDQHYIGVRLRELRNIIDERERIAVTDRELSGHKSLIERELSEKAKSLGVDKFSNDVLTFSMKDETSYRVDPEKWQSVYEWAVANGHTAILFHRVSNRVIDEMVRDGIGLPEAITMDIITKISTRRK